MFTETDIARSCCFTGHRDIPPQVYGEVTEAVKAEIMRLYRLGVRRFIAGGALGFDMICAETVLALRPTLPEITLTLALPCRGHDLRWSRDDRARLIRLTEGADETVYVSETYSSYCMFKRNRFMVDESLYCISYCTRKRGGSYYTVNYARSRGRVLTEVSGAAAD